ncbi:unnamed protein product [Brassica oleracea]|uniref:(rape) hypothetical protein n=1 Tax=Brassica napus TaxID=3708 RepID=A0A816KQG7_BRANA|nr:unnamed protein product [Brassica napus]
MSKDYDFNIKRINLCSLLLVKSPVSFHGIHIWRYEEEFRWICGDLEMLGTSKRIKLSGEEERWFSDRHVADGGTRLLFSNPENSKNDFVFFRTISYKVSASAAAAASAASSAAAAASMKTVVVRFADADAAAYYIATADFIGVSRRTWHSDAASDAVSCVNETNKG